MALDYNTKHLPTGTIGWTDLLGAVEAANPGDENEWLEFKANLDPTTPEGRGGLAKAIVAFANRDPERAAAWFDGHGVILIGIEPGNVLGVDQIDPAVLHDKVHGHLAEPAPAWDATQVTYNSKNILIVMVAPPKPGDPIACVGKGTTGVEDGDIYTRKLGKSVPVKSTDIRRLSDRLLASGTRLGDLIVATSGTVTRIDYPAGWVDDWVMGERDRFLALLPPEGTPVMTGFAQADPSLMKVIEGIGATAQSNMFGRWVPEARTKEKYKAQVEAYLDACSTALHEAFTDLKAMTASKVTFTVVNSGDNNYERLVLTLHVEGDVSGYGDAEDFYSPRDYLPDGPRPWGRRWVPSMSLGPLLANVPYTAPMSFSKGPSPKIVNGGSVDIETLPAHVRPHSSADMITVLLIAPAGVAAPVRARWTATATNVPGKVEGETSIAVAATVTDLAGVLAYQPPPKKDDK